MKKKNKGFTLIELIIAIAILVILTGLLAPQFMKYIDQARRAKKIQTLDAIYRALVTSYAEIPQTEKVGRPEDDYIYIQKNGPTDNWLPVEKELYAEMVDLLNEKEMKRVEISILVNSGEEDLDWEDNLDAFVIKYYTDNSPDFCYYQKGFGEEYPGTYGEYRRTQFIPWKSD